jgi:hypothetical protein
MQGSATLGVDNLNNPTSSQPALRVLLLRMQLAKQLVAHLKLIIYAVISAEIDCTAGVNQTTNARDNLFDNLVFWRALNCTAFIVWFHRCSSLSNTATVHVQVVVNLVILAKFLKI